MPLHLNAITNDSQNTALFAEILHEGVNNCDSAFITEDGAYLHLQRSLVDTGTDTVIGRLIFTVRNNEEEKVLETLDIDIVLDTALTSKIRFLRMRDGSSDANEYYEIETAENEQHLIIETVNRHTEPNELVDTERDVFISVFPFQLSVYEDINAFNREIGFADPVTVAGTDLKVEGLSYKFSMPGGVFGSDEDGDESYSFLVGKVESFKDVSISFGDFKLPFVLVQVDTALGVVPVAMGRAVFDLSNLKPGCIVGMNADVKADISIQRQFKRTSK